VNLSFNDHIERAMAHCFTPARVANNEIQQHEWELRTFLRMVEDELKPDLTVELGTYKGWTSAFLSNVTAKRTISVDINDYGRDESSQWGNHLLNLFCDAAEQSTVDLVMKELGGPIDLLFIDDGHYYETIVKEFEIWKPHVRPGGWIVFHDINPLANIGPHGTQPDCIQVPRFWKELSGDKTEIIATEDQKAWMGHLPHGGLGILI